MVNLKKNLAVVFFAAACFCIFPQNSAGSSNESSQNTEISALEQKINSSFNAESSSSASNQVTLTAKPVSSVGMFIRMIFVLIIVIGLIYGVLWFIKNKTNVVKTDDDFLRRVAYIDIAPGKSVEVITLIDRAYLIGVTEGSINLLGEISDKELINAMNLNADKKQNTKHPLNFNDVLNLFMAKGKTQNVFSETERKMDNMFENRGERQ